MIYLSGAVRPSLLGIEGLGVMLTPMMGNNPDLTEIAWAADTGCFAAPEKFSLDGYLSWLESRSHYQTTCLFATAPDVVGNAEATWERSRDVLPLIRALGYPAALVAQDGIQQADIDWDAFDALFIGGTTSWKLSEPTYALVAEARRRGKWTHQGRVNSLRRLRACAVAGFDSADGTYIAFGPDRNGPRVLDWLETLERQPSLWGERG